MVQQVMEQLIKILQSNGIGILPTDTIYGIVGKALSKEAVERIYKIKNRDLKKPLIILISSIDDLSLFDINPTEKEQKILSKLWPGQVSVILPCPNIEFEHLHRRTKTLAFRLPAKEDLRKLIKKTGPLVAPSANPESKPPAKNTAEANEYFSDKVDFYHGEQTLTSSPSTIVALENGNLVVKRKGSTEVKP